MTRRLLALPLLLVLAALALGGCGSDDGATGSATAATAEDAFPVTIRSLHGTATIGRAPERVVTLDNQATDDVLALGVTPVGMAKVTYVEGDVQTWTKAALRGARPALLDTDTQLPYERIAALRPDLILAPHTFLLDEAAYARLRRIAPTVHFERGALQDDWRQTMRRVGRALGRSERAEQLIERTDLGLATAQERTPAFDGATVNIVNADPSGIYAINDPQDYSMRLAADLGMRIAPRVARLKGQSGRALVSRERLDLLDADLLVVTSVSSEVLDELERDPLFRRLDAVREGRYLGVPIGTATSLAFPSVLSVQFAARELLPRMARAVAGRA